MKAGDSSSLYLIDGSAYFFRGYHANQDLARSDGFPTGAIFSIMRLLLQILQQRKPDLAVFFMDRRGRNFRHDIFADYKANRMSMPEPLIAQIDPVLEGSAILGFNVLRLEGFEADDGIASLESLYHAQESAAGEENGQVVIVGADKDLRQCLGENTIIWDPMNRKSPTISLGDFEKEWGFPPSSWPDFQALTGDASDNIPGVPGVGPKTAVQILRTHPTLEDIKERFSELGPSLQKKLQGHLEEAFLFRRLTRLSKEAVPLDDNFDRFRLKDCDIEKLEDFLRRFEMRGLLREVRKMLPTKAAEPEEKDDSSIKEQASSASAKSPMKAGKPLESQKRLSLLELAPPEKKMLSKNESMFPVDPELLSSVEELPDALSGAVVGLIGDAEGLSVFIQGKSFFFSKKHPGRSSEDWPKALAAKLKGAALLAVPSLKEFWEIYPEFINIPLDLWFDLELAAYLLSPDEHGRGLNKIASLAGLRIPEGHLELAENPNFFPQVVGLLKDLLKKNDLDKLYLNMELPLVPVLLRMQNRGIAVDLNEFAVFLEEVNEQLQELTRQCHELAGGEFNLRSSSQLAEILYGRMGIKPKGKTPKGQASTSQDVLERLELEHRDQPFLKAILNFRKLEKLRSTYLEPLPKIVRGGRLYTNFNQTATATGRLSSSGPNLQNIPIRGPFGRRMRACFVADLQKLLICADYSQIELRILAHLSGDKHLLEAFKNGEDIHARTAGALFNKNPADVTPDERRQAKTINFGLLYGMGPQKLGRELGISVNEAKDFISRYFEVLPGVRAFHESVKEDAKKTLQVLTITGRRRPLPEIVSQNRRLASQAERQAVNTKVQGSAADIIKLAMLEADKDEELRAFEAIMLLQVHDELVFEAPSSGAEQVADRLTKIMTGVVTLKAPLIVDVGVGQNWAEAHS